MRVLLAHTCLYAGSYGTHVALWGTPTACSLATTPHPPGLVCFLVCCPGCTPGPGDAPLRGAEQQLLCAGELECLLQRQRGVVMVQLCAGWDTSGVPQPVDNPLVVYQLQQVLARPDLSIFMSQAPGGCRRGGCGRGDGAKGMVSTACVGEAGGYPCLHDGGWCEACVLCEAWNRDTHPQSSP
jgi:hypothetical protein